MIPKLYNHESIEMQFIVFKYKYSFVFNINMKILKILYIFRSHEINKKITSF